MCVCEQWGNQKNTNDNKFACLLACHSSFVVSVCARERNPSACSVNRIAAYFNENIPNGNCKTAQHTVQHNNDGRRRRGRWRQMSDETAVRANGRALQVINWKLHLPDKNGHGKSAKANQQSANRTIKWSVQRQTQHSKQSCARPHQCKRTQNNAMQCKM